MSIKAKISKLTKLVILGSGIFLINNSVFAKDYHPIIYGFGNSWHSNLEMENNNQYFGFGGEINNQYDLVLQHAPKNSHGVPSTFLGLNYINLCSEDYVKFCFGISAGLATGYEIISGLNITPICAGLVKIRIKDAAVNFRIPPNSDFEVVGDFEYRF